MSRLRGGAAGAARGAGATGQLTIRADSAFYSKTVIATAVKFDVRFSITARQDKRIGSAIEAITDDAWQAIPYWLSTPEVSGADIAINRAIAAAGVGLTLRTGARWPPAGNFCA